MTHQTIQQGSKGDLVKLAQMRLNERMVISPPLTIDGEFGPLTENAVKADQTGRSTAHPLAVGFPLKIDGIVGPKTWFRLDPETIRKGSRGDEVKLLQELLKRLANPAFDPGTIDGDFGPRTEKAVKAFQGANSLVVDGIVGPKTWAALKS